MDVLSAHMCTFRSPFLTLPSLPRRGSSSFPSELSFRSISLWQNHSALHLLECLALCSSISLLIQSLRCSLHCSVIVDFLGCLLCFTVLRVRQYLIWIPYLSFCPSTWHRAWPMAVLSYIFLSPHNKTRTIKSNYEFYLVSFSSIKPNVCILKGEISRFLPLFSQKDISQHHWKRLLKEKLYKSF